MPPCSTLSVLTLFVIFLQCHILVEFVCYNNPASGEYRRDEVVDMLIDKETEAALNVFRALTPQDQDYLLGLAEALLRSQEGYDDSHEKEP